MPSEWVEKNRYLPAESSSEPGLMKISRTEYMREIMDCYIKDPNIHNVVIMVASQLGKSEALQNLAFFHIAEDPASILHIMPTEQMAAHFSKTRIAGSLRDSPNLHDKVSPVKSRDGTNTILEKTFKGGFWSLCGANSSNPVSSKPCRIVLADEIDRYPVDVKGASGVGGEGDIIELARTRQNTFANKILIACSTPTVTGFSRIEQMYNESSQGIYNIKCQKCGEYFAPIWGHIVWQQNKEGEHLPHTARLVCPHCQHGHTDHDRHKAVRFGKWFHRFPQRLSRGFHLNALCSPWLTQKELVERFLTSTASASQLKTFHNTILGLSFEEGSSAGIDAIKLLTRRELYENDNLPIGIQYITFGTDIQDNRFETTFLGIGSKSEYWVLDHVVTTGDPSQPEMWSRLASVLMTEFTRSDGLKLRAVAGAIDTGGHFTQAAYAFCNKHENRRWWGIKGMGGTNATVWPKKPSKRSRSKLWGTVYMVGTVAAKELIFSYLRNNVPGSAYFHFNMAEDEEWFNQLLAEKLRIKYRNGLPYKQYVLPTGKRNEAIDCVTYAFAASIGVGLDPDHAKIMNRKRLEVLEKQKQESQPEKPVNEEEKSKLINTNIEPKIPEAPKPKPKRKRSRVAHSSGYLAGLV